MPAMHLLPLLIKSETEHPRGQTIRRVGGRDTEEGLLGQGQASLEASGVVEDMK